jgi:hypothetical protein
MACREFWRLCRCPSRRFYRAVVLIATIRGYRSRQSTGCRRPGAPFSKRGPQRCPRFLTSWLCQSWFLVSRATGGAFPPHGKHNFNNSIVLPDFARRGRNETAGELNCNVVIFQRQLNETRMPPPGISNNEKVVHSSPRTWQHTTGISGADLTANWSAVMAIQRLNCGHRKKFP